MKKLLLGAAALIFTVSASLADEVKLQLQWVTQAQFAGYYVRLISRHNSVEMDFCHCAFWRLNEGQVILQSTPVGSVTVT